MQARMDTERIAELLQPFLNGDALSTVQLNNISTYIDILIRWNARLNLTSVRDPEEMVTRHFGESLFAAGLLFPVNSDRGPARLDHLLDIGSGAGFPGLPIKIWAPELCVTLIESNHKKAAFLREAVRALELTDVSVFSGRAEEFTGDQQASSLVTLRAVERFDAVLPEVVRLAGHSGMICLFIGEGQVEQAEKLAPQVRWEKAAPIPQSNQRVVLFGYLEA